MTATAALRHACDDLTHILAHAHAVLDARVRPPQRDRHEECTAGLCYERQAA